MVKKKKMMRMIIVNVIAIMSDCGNICKKNDYYDDEVWMRVLTG